eukprot:4777362-Prymnesium_polylepis.1
MGATVVQEVPSKASTEETASWLLPDVPPAYEVVSPPATYNCREGVEPKTQRAAHGAECSRAASGSVAHAAYTFPAKTAAAPSS